VTVDHCALEAEPGHRTVELLHRRRRIRRRQGGEASEPIGMRFDGFEQQIVDLPRHRDRRVGLERLTAGLVVREHLHIDAGGIHRG
jgi:hypothetical protein